MDNKIGVVSVSLIVGVFAFWILDLPLFPEKLALSLVCTLLTFFLIEYLVSEGDVNLSLHFKHRYSVWFLAALGISSILTVILVPSIDTVLWVEWNRISILSWGRYLSAMFLLFLPGYITLRLIDNEDRFKGVEGFVLSFLISTFLVPLVAYASLLLNLMGQLYLILLGFDGLLLASYVILNVKRFHGGIREARAQIEIRKTLVLLFVVIFVLLSGFLIRHYGDTLYAQGGDMGDHLGSALSLLNGNAIIGGYGYDQALWFHLFLLAFLELSGFPPINAYSVDTLFFLFPITYLAIYALASAFFKREKTPVVATVFSLFGGFGWIYFLQLRSGATTPIEVLEAIRQANSMTLDIFSPVFFPTIAVPMYLIAIPTFCMLLYLLRSDGLEKTRHFVLVSILIALDVFAHAGAELLLFMVVFLASFFLFRNKVRLKKLSLSMILGLTASVALDLAGGRPVNILGSFGKTIPYGFLFAIAIITFVLSIIPKSPIQLRLLLRRVISDLKLMLASFGLYLYGLSFIIVMAISSDWNPRVHPCWGVPWYFVPMMLGMPLVLTLLYIAYKTREGKQVGDKGFWFFVIVAVSCLFLIEAFRYSNLFFPGLFEAGEEVLRMLRFETYLKMAVSVLGAYALTRFLTWLKQIDMSIITPTGFQSRLNKKLLATFMLGLILILTMPSALLRTEGFTIWSDTRTAIPNDTLGAISYVSNHLSSNDHVMTLSEASRSLLRMAGITKPQVITFLVVLEDPQLEFFLDYVWTRGTKFIYTTEQEVIQLNESFPNSAIVKAIKYLPVCYKNGIQTVYEVPSISPPLPSDTVLSTPWPGASKNCDFTSYYPLWMCALSQLRYEVLSDVDNDIFNCNNIILTHDPQDKAEVERYLRWAQEGGHLIVMNTLQYGEIAKLMSFMSGDIAFIDGVTGKKDSVSLPSIYSNKTYSSDPNVEVLASYTKDGNFISPFMYSRDYGNGKIVYMDIYPIFLSLQEASGDQKRSLFMALGKCFEVTDLPFLSFVEVEKLRGNRPYQTNTNWLEQEINLNGEIRIKSNFLSIIDDRPLHVNYLDLSIVQSMSIEGTSISPRSFSNVTIKSLQFNGCARFTLTTNQAEVVPSSLGQYSLISLNTKFNLTIMLANNTEVSMMIENGSTTTQVSANGGIVTLDESFFQPIEPFISCDSAEFWQARTPKGNVTITVDNKVKVEGEGSIKGTFNATAEGDWQHLSYRPQGSLDLSIEKFFSFQLRSDILPGCVYVQTVDSSGHFSQWFIHENLVKGNWKRFVIDLNKPTAHTPVLPDLSSISIICIGINNPVPSTFWVDDIRITNTTSPSQGIALKTPTVSNQGMSDFNGRAHVVSPEQWYRTRFPYAPLQVNGSVSFKLTYSGVTYHIISDFTFDGIAQSFESNPSQTYWSEMGDVPWMEVMLNPIHFILIILILHLLRSSNKHYTCSRDKTRDGRM